MADIDVADAVGIRALYARYAHAIDSGDGETWADCYTADGTYWSSTFGTRSGRDALRTFAVAHYREWHEQGISTQHWINQSLFEPMSWGVAARTYVLLMGAREAGRPGGREAGRPGGREAGRPGGREAGRPGGREAGRPGGREAGRAGRPGGREAGRPGGREAGRPGGREAGRPGGREAGRPGGREAGRPGGREAMLQTVYHDELVRDGGGWRLRRRASHAQCRLVLPAANHTVDS
ncbi:nuclear transport factor 2 family protein [Pseudonocardia sp. ICBG1293]|uniref:nuclear transport factor 2 family protein n=1 Tax=Pseudonocardia sp. ICBG1293 TaxID=2844382 RepID=UPI001CCBB57E|nr:nuclear transport factor 2 family protein [Pseudonocardia sp. ICBG1293]